MVAEAQVLVNRFVDARSVCAPRKELLHQEETSCTTLVCIPGELLATKLFGCLASYSGCCAFFSFGLLQVESGVG
jgi:hypothetical protein